MYLFHFDILRQHSDGVKKVDQAIKDVEYYRQVQTIHIIQYISYMKVSVPYGKTHLWCSHLYHQKPHFLWLSWRECTKCASHSSAAIRHSPSNNLPHKPLPSNGECIELVLKFVNYIYEFHGLVMLAHQSCITWHVGPNFWTLNPYFCG